jgi:hypothetical protein
MDVSNRRWVYYESCKQLEAVFWKSLESHVGLLNADQVKEVVTRLLGLFCRHAFKFNGVEEISEDETWDLSLLDGQVLIDRTSYLKDHQIHASRTNNCKNGEENYRVTWFFGISK